jgi:hypothetical protein
LPLNQSHTAINITSTKPPPITPYVPRLLPLTLAIAGVEVSRLAVAFINVWELVAPTIRLGALVRLTEVPIKVLVADSFTVSVGGMSVTSTEVAEGSGRVAVTFD